MTSETFYLIAQPNWFEWHPFQTFEEAVDAISGLDCTAVYEAETRPNMAPHLDDVSEKAALAWLEKYDGTIEFGEDWCENNAPEFIERHAEDALVELFDANNFDAEVIRRDQAMLMEARR